MNSVAIWEKQQTIVIASFLVWLTGVGLNIRGM